MWYFCRANNGTLYGWGAVVVARQICAAQADSDRRRGYRSRYWYRVVGWRPLRATCTPPTRWSATATTCTKWTWAATVTPPTSRPAATATDSPLKWRPGCCWTRNAHSSDASRESEYRVHVLYVVTPSAVSYKSGISFPHNELYLRTYIVPLAATRTRLFGVFGKWIKKLF